MSWLKNVIPPKIKKIVGTVKKRVPDGVWHKCNSCQTALSAGAYVQSQNAELLIEVFNRLRSASNEKGRLEMIDEPFDPPIKELDVSGGANQVISDLDDIQKFSSALAMNNVFQRDSIGTILKALREMDDIEISLEDKMFTLSDILYGEEDKVIADSDLEDFEWHYVDNRKQDDE